MMSVTLKLVMLSNFVSVASNANGSLFSNLSNNIRDVINVTMSATLVMLVRLLIAIMLVRLVTLRSE